MADQSFEQIQLSIEDRVALITLNRPDQMNTWTPIMSTSHRSVLWT